MKLQQLLLMDPLIRARSLAIHRTYLKDVHLETFSHHSKYTLCNVQSWEYPGNTLIELCQHPTRMTLAPVWVLFGVFSFGGGNVLRLMSN